MEKTGKDNIKCVRCSNNAIPGTQPPMCSQHSRITEKTASEEPETLRELADNPKEIFNNG